MNESPGIYFDYIGELKINNGHLNVLTPVDVSYIDSHIKTLKFMFDKIISQCIQSKVYNALECKSMLEPILVRYQDIVGEYDSLSHLLSRRNKRSAWFGGIGSVLKQLFGTLTEDDAIRYDNALNIVQDDEKKLASLIKQNILVTNSTLSAQHEILQKIMVNEANLKNITDKLSENLNNLTISSQEILITTQLNYAFNLLDSMILTLSFRLEDILNSILFSYQNVLHPSVITPSRLHAELAKNYRYLPNNVKLPISLDLEFIHVIINISKLTCYYYNNKIMFILHIPLVTPETYSLYNNIPLPTPHDVGRLNSYVTVMPSSKFIAMTKDKTRYCTLDSLTPCAVINSQTYVCDVPNTYTPSARPICESEVLTKVLTGLPTQCETKLLYGNIDIWKPLLNNRWIYVQSSPSKLSIDCVNSDLTVLNILGTGVLNMPCNCTAFCKSTKLIPKFNVLNFTFLVDKTDFNIARDVCCDLNITNKLIKKLEPINLETLNLESLKSYKQLSYSFVKESEQILNQPHFAKYGAHYSILSVIVTCLVLGFLIFKILKCYVKPSSSLSLFSCFKKKTNNENCLEENISLKSCANVATPRLRDIV